MVHSQKHNLASWSHGSADPKGNPACWPQVTKFSSIVVAQDCLKMSSQKLHSTGRNFVFVSSLYIFLVSCLPSYTTQFCTLQLTVSWQSSSDRLTMATEAPSIPTPEDPGASRIPYPSTRLLRLPDSSDAHPTRQAQRHTPPSQDP